MAPRSATLLSGVFALLALEAAAQDLQINTPMASYQCTAAQYAYTCPEPPCTVVARPSDDPSKTMYNFGSVSDASGSVAWTPIDQKEGTAYTMWITDSKGTTISSASVSVAAGSDDSCLGGSGGSKSSAGDKGSASASATSEKNSLSSGVSSGHAKSANASAASSSASGASSAVSGAVSSARVAASTAASPLESGASQASGAAASASASATPDDESGAGSLVLKGSIYGRHPSLRFLRALVDWRPLRNLTGHLAHLLSLAG